MTFVSDLLASVSRRSRELIGLKAVEAPPRHAADVTALARTLLSRRGEASGTAVARAILDAYRLLDAPGRLAVLRDLSGGFGADRARLDAAIAAYQADPSPACAATLHAAAEPRRQELIRRLNLAPRGTLDLVRLRDDLLAHLPDNPDLKVLDDDLVHLFSSWFNRGFLVVRRIDWSTPANILEKIIRYEAVHEIRDWDDLRRRLQPEDRRCYAFFHPRLEDEPLIFVEVALTAEIPGAIGPLIAEEGTPLAADDARVAVFYSISNCQTGLAGISFGSLLIKQVVEELKRELPKLTTFVTLSPVPGFAKWLAKERKTETGFSSTRSARFSTRSMRRTGGPTACAPRRSTSCWRAAPPAISSPPRPAATDRSTPSRGSISAMARGWSASTPARICRKRACDNPMA